MSGTDGGTGTAEHRVWLALGGNEGDRLQHLRAAIDALIAGGVSTDAVSSVYDTPPWGITDQPSFANAAVSGTTALPAYALLALCKQIEAAQGRDFAAVRNGPRPIDIDIALIAGELVEAPELQVPHPRLHERAFVLVPLAEIAPEVRHPRLQRTMRELRDDLDQRGITLIAAAGWYAR